jgi:rhodanese-related sulfurtransferase
MSQEGFGFVQRSDKVLFEARTMAPESAGFNVFSVTEAKNADTIVRDSEHSLGKCFPSKEGPSFLCYVIFPAVLSSTSRSGTSPHHSFSAARTRAIRSLHLSGYGRTSMTMIAILATLLCVFVIAAFATVRLRAKADLEDNSIEPDELHALLNKGEVLLFDVRQPLDVLTYPEIIPGAIRIPPKDAAALSASYSRDEEAVLYCTGVDDKTGVMVLGKVRALNFTRVKLLKGGLQAWKQKGYPVEQYTESFQLDVLGPEPR